MEDSKTRITQSPQARSAQAVNKFAARAQALSADKVSIFTTGHYSGSIPFRGFCTVRVSGPKANPAAKIGTECSVVTWTGNISSTWSDADNWKPTPPLTSILSRVIIPDGVANAPTLSTNAKTGAVIIKSTSLTIQGHTLTIVGLGLPSELYP